MSDPGEFLPAVETIAIATLLVMVAYCLTRILRTWTLRATCATLLPRVVPSGPDIAYRWRRYIPGLVLALVIIGAGLRVTGITHQSLWLDEAFSAYLAAHRFPQILAFVSGSDAHPPLYYLLLHVWLIFGPSVLAMRLLSAIASSAALVPLYLLATRVANTRVALLAAALMGLSAFQVWYGQEVRMYALVTLAIVTAMHAFVRSWQEGAPGSWVIFTCSMLGAFYLDYSALYVYSALVIWFLLLGWRNARTRMPFVLSGGVLVLGYLPWLPQLWQQLQVASGVVAWIGGANDSGLTGTLTDLFFNRSNLLQPDAGSTTALLANALSMVMLSVALWAPRHAPAYPLLTIWLCWPLAIGIAAGLVHHPILIARTMMVVQPAIFLLLAMAADLIWNLRRNGRTALGRRVVAVTAVFCLIIFVMTNVGAQVGSWNSTLKEDWRDAAALVASQQQPGDLVLFNAYYSQMPFDYYFHQSGVRQSLVVEHGYQMEESLLYADLAPAGVGAQSGATLSGYAHVWLILSHTDEADADAVPPWLLSRYVGVHEWHYPGITVQLYQER